MSEQAGVFVDDLGRDSADRGSDHGFLFPESLGDGEAETFAQAFLDDDGGGTLQSVYFEGRPGGKFEKLMSGSPSAAFCASFRTVAPSGSSEAPPPARTN